MTKNRVVPFLLSIIFLVLAIISATNKNVAPTSKNVTTQDTQTYNMKGVWISYITLDMQNEEKSEASFSNKIQSIVNKTKDSGFNTLIFQVRPFSDALYKSSYYPWSHILTGNQGENPGYDPLKIICDICHKSDIKVHAWINPYRVSTKESPKELSDDNPYIKDKSMCFTHNDCIYLDPSNESARKLITNGVKEIVQNYDVDGIQFDDYFYPTDSDETDNETYEKYISKNNSDITKEDWRMQNVNTLIKDVYDTVHQYSNNVVFGISPQGNLKNNRELSADVVTWCEEKGYIDYICPQIYFSLDNPTLSFEESLQEWLELDLHKNLNFYVGLAGYKGGTDDDSGTWLDNDDILQTEIKICDEKNLDGIMLYSYESLLSDTNSAEIANVVKYLNSTA